MSNLPPLSDEQIGEVLCSIPACPAQDVTVAWLQMFARAVAEEAVRLETQRMEVLHRMKYHPNIDGEGDWELFPIDTDECKECFEVLIVRAKGGADSPPP